MAVTDDAEHGRAYAPLPQSRHRQRPSHAARPAGAHAYDMGELGYNYRLPDVQCALGLAQLSRLDGWVAARQQHRRAV